MTKEELKKEAEAKYKIGGYPQLHPDYFAFIHGYLAGAEPREKRIAELEKENAELESDFRICEKNADTYYDKLTKAKEIIRTFLNMPMPNNEEVFTDVGVFLTKAEQFLKETEK